MNNEKKKTGTSRKWKGRKKKKKVMKKKRKEEEEEVNDHRLCARGTNMYTQKKKTSFVRGVLKDRKNIKEGTHTGIYISIHI